MHDLHSLVSNSITDIETSVALLSTDVPNRIVLGLGYSRYMIIPVKHL